MKANPDKCQALAIGKKSMDTNIAFELAGNKIRCENEAKLLGVIIDFELKFNLKSFHMYYYNHYK
jgi:uncharacterized protein (UPF0303 family)